MKDCDLRERANRRDEPCGHTPFLHGSTIRTTEQVLMSTDQNQGLGKLRQPECERQSTKEEEAKQNKTEICIEVPLSVGLNINLHM